MVNDTLNVSGDELAFSMMKDGDSVPMQLPALAGNMGIPGVTRASYLVPHGMPLSTTDCEMGQFRFPVQRFRESIANFRNGPFQPVSHEVAMTASQSSEVRGPNRIYQFIPGQPVMKCRIFMPENKANQHIIRALIDAFKSPEAICRIPAVHAYLSQYPDDRQPLVELLGNIAGGSTRYKATGRYKGVDEVCQITEYILFDQEVSGGGRDQFWALALDVITHLVARRFAEHLGLEREVWIEVQFGGRIYLSRFMQVPIIKQAA